MTLYGLRLLVALLTFVFGVAASRLVGSGGSTGCQQRTRSAARVSVAEKAEKMETPLPMTGHFFFEDADLNGRAITLPQPKYPAWVMETGAKGTVVVLVDVGADGKVVSARAVSGPALLMQAAEEAALRATFPMSSFSNHGGGRGFLTYKVGVK